MKSGSIERIRLALGLLALSFTAVLDVHAQNQWVTLPNGKQFGIDKNSSLSYSYTMKNGKVESLRSEDPHELVKVIVTLKDEPLAAYKGNKAAATASLLSQKSALQAAHSSVKSKIETIAQQLTAKTNFQYQFTIRREYYTAINGMAVECNRGMVGRIRILPEVKKVQPDEEVKADLTGSVHQIRADIVQDSLGYKGDSVLVGEIDTGIDYNNPALGGGFGPGFRVIGGYDFVNNDDDPVDDNGHGTHVAGIIGANGGPDLTGVAPHVKYLAVKVLDANGSGTISDVIAGIEYCMDPDGNPATDDAVDVINMSLGSQAESGSPVDDAVDNATKSGILSVVAAGNSGEGDPSFVNPFGGYTTIGSPGTAPTALTVGACDTAFEIANFSSKGPDPVNYAIKPEIAAPGVNILSTVLGNGTASWSGTSMATPHVTGVAALLKQEHRDWSPDQLKAAIINSARTMKDSLSPVIEGNGCVDALNAATLGLIVDPGAISFGIVDLTVDTWKDTVSFTVRNFRKVSQNVNLQVQSGLPSGVTLSLSQTSFNLGPNQETMVTAILNVPKSVPILNYGPYSYSGNIICRSDSDLVRVPVAFSKINTLVIDCDREAWEILLYDHQSVSISIPSMYGYLNKYIVPMYAGTFDLFCLLHSWDQLGSDDTLFCISRTNVSTKGYNHIILNHSDATFLGFGGLDQARDIKGNPISGLDTSAQSFLVQILPTSRFSMAYIYSGVTPRQQRWYIGPIDSSSCVKVSQEIFSQQGDQALLLRTASSGVKSQSDLNFLTGPGNLGDLHFIFKGDLTSITQPYIGVDEFHYFSDGLYDLSDGYPLPGFQEINLVSNRYTRVLDPMSYYSISAGFGGFGNGPNDAPSSELSTSDFIMDQNGDIQFFDRRPYRPDPSECAHIQTLHSGDTLSIAEGAPRPVVQVPKFQLAYDNNRDELSAMEYAYDGYDDGGVIGCDGTRGKIMISNYLTNTQQFTAQMFTKNGLVPSWSNYPGGEYFGYNAERYGRYHLLAATDQYNLLGQNGQSTIDYEFIADPIPNQDCFTPSLDFFQVLGDSMPVQLLHPGQNGLIHLVVCDPRQNVDSIGVSLLENDGTEIGLVTTHPSTKEYYASIPKNIAGGFHDVVASVNDSWGEKFELVVSPAFYYGQTGDSITSDPRVRLSTYTLNNLNSVHFNAGDTLRYTLTYENYGNGTARDVSVHFPQTNYFVPVGDTMVTIDTIAAGTFRGGLGPRSIPVTLIFLGMKTPNEAETFYTPTITWKSGGRSFVRKYSILVDLSGAATAVSGLGNTIPKEYSLSQNFPNPFNPTTVIAYQLAAVGDVTLKVYDVLGREVKTLVNERQNAGAHTVKFDGSSLSNGVYFYRLHSGSYTATKKLLVLK